MFSNINKELKKCTVVKSQITKVEGIASYFVDFEYSDWAKAA